MSELREAAERVVWFDWTGNDEDACKAIDDLRAALASRSDGGWRPIETAPKDGTPMLFCWWQDGQDTLPVVAGFWSRLSERWCNDQDGGKVRPTHWMPLPKPPQAATSEQEVKGCG